MAQLLAIEGLATRFGEPMAAHTTWRVGGPAWCLATAGDLDQARKVVAAARAHGMPVKALGLGSNLLVSDQGWRGVLLRMRGELALLQREGGDIAAGGGLSGLEWAAGIPGTVGGALATNAGAHGGDMAGLAVKASLLLPTGEVRDFAAAELPAAYRRRRLPAGGLVVAVRLALTLDDPARVAARVKANLERRAASQPLAARTAGSVFKNPPGDFAGRLIEAAGLKGYALGRARVSPVHANFIENSGQASAAEVIALMQEVAAKVLIHSGVELTPEVEVLGHV
jgi:UDP-N-acetylmuramate dehydrogenase